MLYDFLCFSYLPVYAEVQQPHVYLKNSHLEFSNLYLGVSTKSRTTLVNGTLLPTRFHWGKVTEMCAAPPSEWPSSRINVQPPSLLPRACCSLYCSQQRVAP
jgi:hypothetical protein